MRGSKPKRAGVRPTVLVWSAVALALLLSMYTFIALRQGRQALTRSVNRSAEALAESLAHGFQKLSNAGNVINQLYFERWNEAALQMSRRRDSTTLPVEWLYQYGATRMDWCTMSGGILATTDPVAGSSIPHRLRSAESWSLVEKGEEWVEFDLGDGGPTAALVRTGDHVLVLWGVLDRLADAQEDVGAGFLIRKISEFPELVYAVLQGPEGIVLASLGVEEMIRIEDDSLLSDLLLNGGVASRDWVYNDIRVVEASARIPTQQRILRLGLSRQSLDRLDSTITIQFLALGGLLFIMGMGLLGLFWYRNRFTSMARELSAAEELTEELFRGIRSAIMVIDSRGVVQLANPSAGHLLGQPVSALVGRAYSDVAPGDPARLKPLLEQDEASLEHEVSWKDREGRELTLLVSMTRLSGDRGDAVAILHDVTDLRKLTRSAEQNERLAAMGDLAAGVAHEIRNPLNAISIASQRLKSEFEPQNNASEYNELLGHVRREIERVNDTVQQFLSLARGLNLNRQPLDLAELVDTVAAGLKIEGRSKGVEVRVEADAVPPITGDAESLTKVLLNLGQNALHATSPGGHVVLRLKHEGDTLLFAVEDSGIGIEAEDIPHLFRPYFTKKKGGSGIGLALVHRIVTAHGGSCDVKSELGAGTTFTVRLPTHVESEQPG